MRSFVPLVAVSLFAMPSLLAGTIVVSKTGAITTIQAGVDAALAGDTVAIDDGIYQENVTIAAGKTGLRVIATGKVLLEARKANGAGGGPGITVGATGVLVKGLTIRNALENSSGADNGDGIRALAADFTGQALTIEGCDDSGIRLTGAANAKLKSVTIRACGIGVHAIGTSGLLVNKSKFLGTQSAGVQLEGANDTTVSKSTFEGCLGSGGIDCSSTLSNGVTVKDCEFEGVSGLSIFVDGDDFEVRNCRITQCASGIHVADGAGVVVGNTIDDLRDDSIGISLEFNTDTLVADNEIVECSGEAILLRDSTESEVRGNTIRSCAYEGEAALRADATSDALFIDNLVDESGGSGFDIQGSNSSVEDNTVKRSVLDGIRISNTASGTSIDGNLVDRCGSEGLDQRGSNSLIRFNVFKRCRLDLTNVGTATFQDNVFKTGGTNVSFEID